MSFEMELSQFLMTMISRNGNLCFPVSTVKEIEMSKEFAISRKVLRL